MLSDKQIKDIMFDLEKSEGIFQYKVEGVSIYYLLRFWIEIDLRIAHQNILTVVVKKNIFLRVYKKINYYIKYWNKYREFKPIFNEFDKPNDILEAPLLFVSSCNYINKGGYAPHLIDIIEYYYNKECLINFVQRKDITGEEFPRRSPYYHRFLPLYIPENNYLKGNIFNDLKHFLEYLTKKTNVNFSSKISTYYTFLVRIIGEANQLKEYILKAKSKYLFTYSIYTEPSIILACNKTKCKLIEIQHGVLLTDTIYFQSVRSAEAIELNYLLMPDCILTLGTKWKDILINQNSFFNENNIFTLGHRKFDKSYIMEQSKNIENSSIRIVFFLQTRGYNGICIFTDFIIQFIEKYALELQLLNVKIIIRPHPNDLDEAFLLQKYCSSAIEIEDTIKINSLSSILALDIAFSASSMCLYEALAFGKLAISLKKFEGMIQPNGGIQIVETPTELFELIQKYKIKSIEPIPYLEQFNTAILDKFY